MSQTAAQRAAITDLRVSDFAGRVGDHRALLSQERRRGHIVVNGAGADLDLAVLLANTREARYTSNIDEDFGPADAKLHQRDETMAAREELALAARCCELRHGIVQRGCAFVGE